jgi:hypothetical protein
VDKLRGGGYMGMLGGTVNVAMLGLTAVMSVFHFFSLRKEFALRRMSGMIAVGPIVVTIVVYAVIFKKAPMSPFLCTCWWRGCWWGWFLVRLQECM